LNFTINATPYTPYYDSLPDSSPKDLFTYEEIHILMDAFNQQFENENENEDEDEHINDAQRDEIEMYILQDAARHDEHLVYVDSRYLETTENINLALSQQNYQLMQTIQNIQLLINSNSLLK
jgi:hypothetical protein